MRAITPVSALALLAAAGAASAALGQVGTGLFEWQVSADGGLTWNPGLTEVLPTQDFVLLRARASWSSDGGMYMFAGAQFDAVVSTPGEGDFVANPLRPYPVNSTNQTLVVTRFGNQIKVDDSRDTLPPGEGNRGVFPSQLVDAFGGPYNRDNPITIFLMTLVLDGTPGDRDIRALFVAPTGGNTVDRFMRIYTSELGAQNSPLSTHAGATVRVVPAPGALIFGVLAASSLRRRRSA